jgi:hypothetical protein
MPKNRPKSLTKVLSAIPALRAEFFEDKEKKKT